MSHAREFIDFIRRSPSAFHAVASIADMLDQAGFTCLQEKEQWTIAPGGRYYVTRNLSAVIAFTVPARGFAHFQITASHSDSPAFKLKPFSQEIACGKYARLNTEKYGGLLISSWFDRPLSIAGRLLVADENGVSTRLVHIDRDMLMIPNMPIHMNREVNDGFKFNAQVDTLPIYGDERADRQFYAELARAAGVEESSIVGQDLFLYNRTPGTVWGAHEEFFSCPQIDDLECAYTTARAFLNAGECGHINVLAVFDNEETGSGTKQGAGGDMMQSVLSRAAEALGASPACYQAAVACSFMVSADNAHAVHPNHPEKYDADNRCYMNGGIVIKHSANQKYTSDGVSAAIFSQICRKANVPVQHFANRSDMMGGSTLGNIANSHTSMNTVDIGLPQLAMHSCYETAGTADVTYMIDGLTAFYNTEIIMQGDGAFTLK